MFEKNAEFLEFHLWYIDKVHIHGGGHTVDGKDPAPVYIWYIILCFCLKSVL